MVCNTNHQSKESSSLRYVRLCFCIPLCSVGEVIVIEGEWTTDIISLWMKDIHLICRMNKK